MLTLKKLKFSNIGRFVSEQEIVFNEGGVVQVDAKNLNTGGSSGSGKSTVFHALDYLLGVNEIPASSLQTRGSKDEISVSGDFTVNGKEVLIKRSKKKGLSITIDGVTVEGASKITEEHLDSLIGIDRKLFKRMFHKKQKEGGFFLSLTAKESYEFLMSVLGLEKWSKSIDKTDDLIKSASTVLEANKVQIEVFKDRILNIKRTITEHEGNKPELSQNHQNAQDFRLLLLENDKKALLLKENLEKELFLIKKPVFELVSEEETLNKMSEIKFQLEEESKRVDLEIQRRKENIFKVEAGKAKLLEQKKDIEQQLKQIPSIEGQITRLKEELLKLESHRCHTCSQTWVGEDVTRITNEKRDNIHVLTTKKAEILESQTKLDKVNSDIERITRILEDLPSPTENILQLDKMLFVEEHTKLRQVLLNVKETNKTRETMANLEADNKRSSIKERYNGELSQIDKENSQAQAKLAEIEAKWMAFDVWDNKTKKLNEEMELAIAGYQVLAGSLLKISKEIEIMVESKRLIKSYTMQIFQDTLDYIGEYTGQILSNIPALSNASIYFESVKETKSGTMKEEVNAVINFDGESDIPIKTLSGGERTAIDLAVDLAVIDMIEDRAGKGLNLFILDEPFEGLDNINKQQCLDLLKTIKTNKTLLVVDHGSELKEMISNSITVVRDGSESKIICQ